MKTPSQQAADFRAFMFNWLTPDFLEGRLEEFAKTG
jgi:hypothetical protein